MLAKTCLLVKGKFFLCRGGFSRRNTQDDGKKMPRAGFEPATFRLDQQS